MKRAALPVIDPPRQVSIHRLEKPSLLASQPTREWLHPTPERPLIISASELGSWIRCRVQHHWSYQCQLESKKPSIPRMMGTLGHLIFETWYALPSVRRTPKAMQKIARRLCRETPITALTLEDKTLLTSMVIGYAEWVADQSTEYGDAVLEIGKCYPEHKFKLPLVKDRSIMVHGKIDLRFKPGAYKHTIAALESKFVKQISMDGLDNKLQLSVYLWAMMEEWPQFKRYIIYFQNIRKQMPGPRVKAALFHREPVERDRDEIRQWVDDTRNAALDMVNGAVYPSPQDSCNWRCDFNVPCLMRGNDSDVKHILKTEFQKRVYETSKERTA